MVKLLAGLGICCAVLAFASSAGADPTPDGNTDVFGLITPDESAEISSSGHATCVSIDQGINVGQTEFTAVQARTVALQNQGWDVESSNDIVWEQVEARCPEYLDAVKRVVRSYGDAS